MVYATIPYIEWNSSKIERLLNVCVHMCVGVYIYVDKEKGAHDLWKDRM